MTIAIQLGALLQANPWVLFIGRFHPILVHLPIGFLLIGALLEIGRRSGKIAVNTSTISFILIWSAIGATFACIAGYLLSLGGGYDEKLLDNHMWKGIGVAALAWVAWIFQSDLVTKLAWFSPKIYLTAFVGAVLLTMIAGHDGGSLTHGEDFLTQYTPEPFRGIAGLAPLQDETEETKEIYDVKQALVYQDIIKPILEAKCNQCHNSGKQKGNLRTDELAMLIKGGKNGPAFLPGKSLESMLIKRCLLDENEEEHMPPKGKPQLSADQVALISWWIDQGAPADKKVADLKVMDQLGPALTALESGKAPKEENPSKNELGISAIRVEPGSQKDIDALRKEGLIVNTLSQDQNFLEVSAVNASDFSDKQAELLLPLASQITWLKLAGTKISDSGMNTVAKLVNLTKLHLEHTSVSDEGILKLKNNKHLEYLNIVSTKVSDTGLRSISGLKNLRTVYIWQSDVTDSTVSQLSKRNRNLRIIDGVSEDQIAKLRAVADSTVRKNSVL